MELQVLQINLHISKKKKTEFPQCEGSYPAPFSLF